MRESKYNEYRELSWRRPLTAAENAELQEFLRAAPEKARQWQTEEALSRMLEQLPAAPVSSNFTARVVAAAQREAQKSEPERATELPWLFRSWWPRLAAGAVMMGAGFWSFLQYHDAHPASSASQNPARSALTAHLTAVPPVEWLDNFDTISRLDKVNVADDELLSALQ